MFTVLVPLDETSFAESILPDAVSLAGPGGRLALVYVLRHRRRGSDETGEADDAERYLANEGQLLQARGYQVVVKVLVGADTPHAIDEGVAELINRLSLPIVVIPALAEESQQPSAEEPSAAQAQLPAPPLGA